jgi:iron(III) transport system permease protein
VSMTPLALTLQLIAVSVAIAAAIGIVGAWAASVLQSAGRIGRFGAGCFLLAMITAVATPLVLQAAAWEATAGKFGWWTMTQTGARTNSAGVYGVFSGLLACGWIHGLFGAAMVALATWFGTTQTPDAIIQQSRFDLGPIARWWRVRLPIASPWVVASLIATSLVAATEMTVVDLYGYETIADTFYLYNTIDPSLANILWTCAMPLTLAIALLMWMFVSRRRLLTFQAGEFQAGEFQANHQQVDSEKIPSWIMAVCWLIVPVVIATVTLVPIAGLVIKAGHVVTVEDGLVQATWSAASCWEHVWSAPRLFSAEYAWTATIGITTGLVAVLIAWPLATVGRWRRRVGKYFDLGTVLLFAIPGPVIGMSVVHLFQIQLPGFRFLYGQTIVAVVIALLVRAVPISYWVLRSGYRGISERVLDAARLDLSVATRIWQVDRPLLARHLVFALLAASLYASGDVPATLPVIPAGVTTVGTRLFELLHNGARYQEASLAIWYVGVVVAFVVGLARITRFRRNV